MEDVQKTEDLQQYYIIVEEGIRAAGVEPELCRSETEGQWNLKRHESDVWVDVWPVEQEGRTYFQVMTPLVEIPEENHEEFYRELLDLNYQMVGASLVTYKNGVYVKFTGEVDFLTADLVAVVMNRVGYYGQVFEQGFIKKFNTKKLEHRDE
jgi:hypothetical protein